MIAVSTCVNTGFQPRKAALPEMATAVLILNEAREVEYLNRSAQTLFTPVDPNGCTLQALLASCCAEAAGDIFSAIDDCEAHSETRIKLTDGRSLDCTLRALSSGGFVVSLEEGECWRRFTHLFARAEHAACTYVGG